MKLAYIFLTRVDLNQSQLWKDFFQNQNQNPNPNQSSFNSFNIYCHPKHPEQISPDSPLYQKTIPEHLIISNTKWGTTSLVKATNALLQYAYEDDPLNQKFILLSESCIPIRNFQYIYDKLLLIPNNNSYISSFNQEMRPGDKSIKRRYERFERYSENRHPVPLEEYRKQSQWMILDRKHVKMILDNNTFFLPIYDNPKIQNADENYYINLLIHLETPLDQEVINQKKTYKKWTPKDNSHPKTFENIKPKLLQKIREEPEDYFFMRKVSPNARLSSNLFLTTS